MKLLFLITFIINLFNTNSQTNTNSFNLDIWQTQILNLHNNYRKIHCVPKLKWSKKIASEAQKYSDYLCNNDLLVPSDSIYGENLYMTYNSNNNIIKNCVDIWYNSNIYYNYSNPVFSKESGLFTQLIWKSSKKLGCGYSECTVNNKNIIIINCYYKKPGNLDGAFEENVIPKCI